MASASSSSSDACSDAEDAALSTRDPSDAASGSQAPATSEPAESMSDECSDAEDAALSSRDLPDAASGSQAPATSEPAESMSDEASGSEVAAPATPEPAAECIPGALDGDWGGPRRGCTINGDQLTWRDGSTSSLRAVRSRIQLVAEGVLLWSDGGVWMRNEAVPEVPLAQCEIRMPKLMSLEDFQRNPKILQYKGRLESQRELQGKESEKTRAEREARERALEKAGIKQCPGERGAPCGAWNARTHNGRCMECGKDQKREEDQYLGKPHLPPSSKGGGWGGPKEGHDKDERFMLRAEARELPDFLYKSWSERGRFVNDTERKMLEALAMQTAVKPNSSLGVESNSEETDSEEAELRKMEKKKEKKSKKAKKAKKDKKKKKGKKDRGKKVKKDGKKKKKKA